MNLHERLTLRRRKNRWTALAGAAIAVLGCAALAAAPAKPAAKAPPDGPDPSGLYNVSLLDLGARAKGSGLPCIQLPPTGPYDCRPRGCKGGIGMYWQRPDSLCILPGDP
jgi:hypothetical protein